MTAPFPDGELDGNPRVVPFEELMATPVTRLTLRDPTSTSEEFLERTERIGLHGVEYAVGWSAWLDINPEGVSKGAALEAIRRRLGVEPMHTVAVGDQRNDLEMLQWAARGRRDGQRPRRGQGRRRRGHRARRRRRPRRRPAGAPVTGVAAPIAARGIPAGGRVAPMDTSEVTSAARQAGNSPVVEWGARLGYVVVGIVHLVIAWIALKVAWGIGGGSEDADASGALKAMARSGTGPLLLWITIVGFLFLTVWQAIEAVVSHGEVADRVKAAAKAVMYAFFAWTAFRVAQGAAASSEEQTEDFTAEPHGQPAGRLLVGVVGLVVLGVAGYHVYKGWTKKFLEDLREHPGDWAVTAGRIGYIAKGVALVVVGLLLPRRRLAGRPRKGAGAGRRVEDRQGPAVRALPADPGGRGHRGLRRLLLRAVPLRAGLNGSSRGRRRRARRCHAGSRRR